MNTCTHMRIIQEINASDSYQNVSENLQKALIRQRKGKYKMFDGVQYRAARNKPCASVSVSRVENKNSTIFSWIFVTGKGAHYFH